MALRKEKGRGQPLGRQMQSLGAGPERSGGSRLFIADTVGGLDHHAGKGEEGDGIGDDHEVVEHIGESPDQVVGHQGAQENEHESDDRIYRHGLFPEEIDDIDLAEEVPAQHSGEGKEEEADGHKRGAQVSAKDRAKGGLGQIGAVEALGDGAGVAVGQRAVAGVEGADDHQGVEGQDNKGVDEDADHGHHGLVVRVLDIGLGVGVRSGAHAGLIGEEAPLGALADGGLDGVSESAANDGLGLEGIAEDHGEGGGDVLEAGDEHGQAAHQEDGRHDGDQLFSDGGQPLDAAQEDEGTDDHQNDAYDPGGDAESGLEGGADGVGLDHAAHKAQGQDDSDRKEAGQEFAEASLESGGDVVDGTAMDGAVGLHDPGLDGQGGLGVDGGHAKEGDDPHPEDGAWAAGKDGAGGAHDVAGAHLGGDGGGQGLEGAHAGGLPAAVEGEVAEDLLHALPKAADLDEAGADAVPESDRDEQKDQNIVGQIGVDGVNDGV